MKKVKKRMEVIPFEKLSKKEQRKINNAKRNDWGGLNPVTRIKQNKKTYSRSKAKAELRRELIGG